MYAILMHDISNNTSPPQIINLFNYQHKIQDHQQEATFFLNTLKPAAHLRKELSKMPREAFYSAVSSCVRQSFGEKFASRGCENKIKHV